MKSLFTTLILFATILELIFELHLKMRVVNYPLKILTIICTEEMIEIFTIDCTILSIKPDCYNPLTVQIA